MSETPNLAHIYYRDPNKIGYASILELQAKSGGGDGVLGEYYTKLQVRTLSGQYHHVSFNVTARSIDAALKQIMAIGQYLTKGNLDLRGCKAQILNGNKCQITTAQGMETIKITEYHGYMRDHFERTFNLSHMHERADVNALNEARHFQADVQHKVGQLNTLIDRKNALAERKKQLITLTPEEESHLEILSAKRSLEPTEKDPIFGNEQIRKGWNWVRKKTNKAKSLEELSQELERELEKIRDKVREAERIVREGKDSYRRLCDGLKRGASDEEIALLDQGLKDQEMKVKGFKEQIDADLAGARSCINAVEEVVLLVPAVR